MNIEDDKKALNFTCRDGARQYMSDLMVGMDARFYGKSFDDLLEYATENFLDYLKENHNFLYGYDCECDEIDDETFYKFFE